MFSIESNVRSYSRSFPAIFHYAYNEKIKDTEGNTYIDFLSGCGSLNYGHNNEALRKSLVEYIEGNGITMSLDLKSSAKEQFLFDFYTNILNPKKLEYRVQFTGPTGTNAVESAIKLSRKVTGRSNIIAFTNAFHGCSLGSLSLTANVHHRNSSIGQLNNVTRLPFDGYFLDGVSPAKMLDQYLADESSGVDMPAAIIFECVQGEGGLNVLSKKVAKDIEKVANKYEVLVIVDEIQTGCGRCGEFFAFERLGIKPDMVTLGKSISGYGLPMSLVLIHPNFDKYSPGEHNGTFRGNNHAFVTASKAICKYWTNDNFLKEINEKTLLCTEHLTSISNRYQFKLKGIGMMQGLETNSTYLCDEIRRTCYKKGVIIEASGPKDSVLKLMPPLTIEKDNLILGIDILEESIALSVNKLSNGFAA